MIKESLYDFIYHLLNEENQFSSPSDALDHPFIKNSEMIYFPKNEDY